MTTYEKIRERRNKVIPPVLEAGCEIIVPNNVNGETHDEKTLLIEWDKEFQGVDGWFRTSHLGVVHTNKFKEILGKPVTLNDILLMGRFRSIDVWGNIKIAGKRQKEGNFISEKEIILCKLKLTKDIEHQEEEVLLKIWEIIK